MGGGQSYQNVTEDILLVTLVKKSLETVRNRCRNKNIGSDNIILFKDQEK